MNVLVFYVPGTCIHTHTHTLPMEYTLNICLLHPIHFHIWMHLTLLKLCMKYLNTGTRCGTIPFSCLQLTSASLHFIATNQPSLDVVLATPAADAFHWTSSRMSPESGGGGADGEEDRSSSNSALYVQRHIKREVPPKRIWIQGMEIEFGNKISCHH